MHKKITTKGVCSHCNNLVTKVSALKHIQQCFTESPSEQHSYIIKIQWPHKNPYYWIYVAIPLRATLKQFDRFLRDIWLECCGHLSLFRIHSVLFSSYYEPNPFADHMELPMTAKIGNVLAVGVKFTHDYDFGSTTTLLLEVVALKKSTQTIQVLMRNEEPNFICSCCDCKASYINYDYDEYLCADCYKEDEYFSPLRNSPRSGVCGY